MIARDWGKDFSGGNGSPDQPDTRWEPLHEGECRSCITLAHRLAVSEETLARYQQREPQWQDQLRETKQRLVAHMTLGKECRQDVVLLREALQMLYDEQNDAPLETRRPQWAEAMQLAERTLRTVGMGSH